MKGQVKNCFGQLKILDSVRPVCQLMIFPPLNHFAHNLIKEKRINLIEWTFTLYCL